MDYLLIAVIAFLASYLGTSLAVKSGDKPVVSVPNPVKAIVEKIEAKKTRKIIEEHSNITDAWLYEGEGKDED